MTTFGCLTVGPVPIAYFVSICTKDRKCLFGDTVNCERVLNDSGRLVTTVWNELPQRVSNIELIEYAIMPNTPTV